uniref:ANK_REP_REGION domain-containing protein n=1 Tax=Heterorhabditis bacteriophora TaxID=37862 RepID=A0A1I7XFV2_HETBA
MADLPGNLDLILSDFAYIDGFLPTVADLVALNIVKEQDLEGKNHLKRWHKHIKTFSQNDRNKFSRVVSSDFAKYLLDSYPIVHTMSPKETTTEVLNDLPQLVLSELDANSQGFNSIHMAAKLSIDHQKLVGVIKSLLAQEGVISAEDVTNKHLELSSEGRDLTINGSHEFNVYEAIGENGLLQADVMKLPFGKVGMNKAMAAGWIMIDKSTGKVVCIIYYYA